jgi:hypothetical protein
MQDQTNLIYQSFLFEFPKAEFSFPEVCDDDSFSILNSSLVNFSPDQTCLKTENSCQYEHVVEFDSQKEWIGNINSSFKSCLSPEFRHRVEEFPQKVDAQAFYNIGDKTSHSKIEKIDGVKQNIQVKEDVQTYTILRDTNLMNKLNESKPKLATKKSENWGQYIEDVINNGIRTPSVRAGRPKHDFDTSYSTMLAFYEDYLKDLQCLIETKFSEKRSDTFRNTIFSYMKKLPIKLREKSCSVSDPKSKKFSVYLNAFLVPFISCFLPFFGLLSQVPKIELFLYFICICYPEDKCIHILNTLLQEGSITEGVSLKIKRTLKLRKGKSKKDINIFILSNPCFSLYCNQLVKKLDLSSFDGQAAQMVKDFIVNPEGSAHTCE